MTQSVVILYYRCMVNSTVVETHVSKIVACLTSVLSSPYDTQRIVVAAFFAEVSYVCFCLFLYKNQKICYPDFNMTQLLKYNTVLPLSQICSIRFENIHAINVSLNEIVNNEERWKHCGKRRNCLSWVIFPLTTKFSKIVCKWERVN